MRDRVFVALPPYSLPSTLKKAQVGSVVAVLNTHTLLIVDDETTILKALERVFRRKVKKLLLAESAENALEILATEPADIIISDMRMPGMSGAELFKQIVADNDNNMRILLTGYSDLESSRKAINEGKIFHYLTKPWENSVILAKAQEASIALEKLRETSKITPILKEKNNVLEKK